MDESDEEAVGDEYVASDDNPYPLEGKYKNAADKAYVLGLSEVHREQIIAEREEEAAEKRRGIQLKILFDGKDQADKSIKKRKAADIEDERRAARAPKRSTALESYTRQREEARDNKGRRGTAHHRRRSHSRSESSQPDASGESDVEYAPIKAKATDAPVELADVERIRVGRTRLAKYCFYPQFEETMIGCFARVCVGQDQPGHNVYRLCQIKRITTGKPYLLDATPAVPKFYTDQYVVLAHGKLEKEWPFSFCSDSPFSESEFARWLAQLKADKLTITHKSYTARVIENINKLIDYHPTSEDINVKLEKKNKYAHLLYANGTGAPPPIKKDDMAEKIRLRNERTRKQNAEDVRKALIAEKSKARQAMMRAQKEKAAREAVAKETSNSLSVPKPDMDDLFSGGSDVSHHPSPALGPTAPAVQSASHKDSPQKRKGLPRFSKMELDDDVIGSMDLGIDIEI